jgi:hypothetical protein
MNSFPDPDWTERIPALYSYETTLRVLREALGLGERPADSNPCPWPSSRDYSWETLRADPDDPDSVEVRWVREQLTEEAAARFRAFQTQAGQGFIRFAPEDMELVSASEEMAAWLTRDLLLRARIRKAVLDRQLRAYERRTSPIRGPWQPVDLLAWKITRPLGAFYSLTAVPDPLAPQLQPSESFEIAFTKSSVVKMTEILRAEHEDSVEGPAELEEQPGDGGLASSTPGASGPAAEGPTAGSEPPALGNGKPARERKPRGPRGPYTEWRKKLASDVEALRIDLDADAVGWWRILQGATNPNRGKYIGRTGGKVTVWDKSTEWNGFEQERTAIRKRAGKIAERLPG